MTNFYIGCTTSNYVMLDYDNMTLYDVLRDANKLLKKHELVGYALFSSSRNNYHVVFTKKMSWRRVQKILQEAQVDRLQKWEKLRVRRQNVTLRIYGNSAKPVPEFITFRGRPPLWFFDFLRRVHIAVGYRGRGITKSYTQ